VVRVGGAQRAARREKVRRGRLAVAREVGAVELIVDQARGHCALADAAGRRRKIRRPGIEARVERPFEQSDAELAEARELAAKIENRAPVAQVVTGNALIALEQKVGVALELDPRGDEEQLARVQGLIELARQRRGLADLQIGTPLGAERVEPGLAIAREQ